MWIMGKTGKFLTAFSEQTAPGRQKCRTMLNASGLSASPCTARKSQGKKHEKKHIPHGDTLLWEIPCA
ncbi:MAG: hypothetical protein DMG39_16485 [Acidobacteria bacterium]|nr:MAG: hypothetical protein DMG39_16485 [Acidobacteriota bacterium]